MELSFSRNLLRGGSADVSGIWSGRASPGARGLRARSRSFIVMLLSFYLICAFQRIGQMSLGEPELQPPFSG